MIGKAWVLIKDTVSGFIEHGDLSRGAAIAYYTIFSIAPLLIIVIAIAGLVFGHDAAQGAIVGQLRGLIGKHSAEILQSMIQSASHETTGVFATIIGVGMLLLTSTGAFAEIQSALNAVWKASPSVGFLALIRSRLMSLGLVFTLATCEDPTASQLNTLCGDIMTFERR
jgi:membrane protein